MMVQMRCACLLVMAFFAILSMLNIGAVGAAVSESKAANNTPKIHVPAPAPTPIHAPAPSPLPPHHAPPMPSPYQPIDCASKCKDRCKGTQNRPDRCLSFCKLCCEECKCVPSGQYGNKDECPCYRDKTSKRGGPKCP